MKYPNNVVPLPGAAPPPRRAAANEEPRAPLRVPGWLRFLAGWALLYVLLIVQIPLRLVATVCAYAGILVPGAMLLLWAFGELPPNWPVLVGVSVALSFVSAGIMQGYARLLRRLDDWVYRRE